MVELASLACWVVLRSVSCARSVVVLGWNEVELPQGTGCTVRTRSGERGACWGAGIAGG